MPSDEVSGLLRFALPARWEPARDEGRDLPLRADAGVLRLAAITPLLGNRADAIGARHAREKGRARFQRALFGILAGKFPDPARQCASESRLAAFALRPARMPDAARWKRALPFSFACSIARGDSHGVLIFLPLPAQHFTISHFARVRLERPPHGTTMAPSKT